MQAAVLKLSDRTVDLVRGTIVGADGDSVRLTHREVALLSHLVERSPDTVDRDELLADLWKYSDTVVTRAVDIAVRRLRTKIEADPSSPQHVLTVRGEGYRFVGPIPEVLAQPARPSLPRVPARLPEPIHLFGRDRELALLAKRLHDEPGVLTLHGPPGVGKTSLAAETARHVREAFEDRVWFVDLAAETDRAGFISKVSTVLAVPGSDDEGGTVDRVGNALALRGSSVVVLDNLEQLATVAPEVITTWLGLAPETRFVITSRVRLGLPREHVVELQPLEHADAVALLQAQCQRLGVSPPSAKVSTELVAHVDGMPLAIELIAPRLRLMRPDKLLKRLDDQLRVASSGATGRPERQTSLRAALEGSFQLLPPGVQRVFAAISVFRGGFFIDAADEVLGGMDADPLEAVQTLRDHALLRSYEPADLPGERRLGLYEAVRQFALQKRTDQGVQDAHADYYASQAGVLVEAAQYNAEAARRMIVDHHNFVVAFEHLIEDGDPRCLDLGLVISQALEWVGNRVQRLALLDRTLQAVANAPLGRLAEVMFHRSRVQHLLATPNALVDATRAMELAVEAEDWPLAVRAGQIKALMEVERGMTDEAKRTQTSTEEFAQRSGDPASVARSQVRRAYQDMRDGDLDGSLCMSFNAVEVLRKHGRLRDREYGFIVAARVARRCGKFGVAEAYLREALAVSVAMGDHHENAVLLGALGPIIADQGRLDEASEMVWEAVGRLRELGEGVTLANRLLAAAMVELVRGRPDLAKAAAHEARTIDGPMVWRTRSLAGATIGIVALWEEDVGLARPELTKALAAYRTVGDQHQTAYVLGWLSICDALDGYPNAALDALKHIRQQLVGTPTPRREPIPPRARGGAPPAHRRRRPRTGGLGLLAKRHRRPQLRPRAAPHDLNRDPTGRGVGAAVHPADGLRPPSNQPHQSQDPHNTAEGRGGAFSNIG